MINFLANFIYRLITLNEGAMNNPVASSGELAHKRTRSLVIAGSPRRSRGGQSNLKNKRLLHFIRDCRGYMFHGLNSYNFMNRLIFINPFQNEMGFNGIPKIALRKSETKTLKKICGLWLN